MEDRLFQAASILREVLDLPESDRAPHVAERCASDADLRQLVEVMLTDDDRRWTGSHEARFDFTDARVRDVADHVVELLAYSQEARSVQLRPGAVVGRYRITGAIAEGGSSSVFEAVHEGTGLRVALKVHRVAFPSAAAQRRFLDEAVILARLRHPGIAQVHDADIGPVGEPEGEVCHRLPWIAVELVPGAMPIDTACKQLGLDRADRLRLVRHVCDAVQHAHQRGVIHRDLKPDNILVGDDGRPRIVDFGIGHLAEANVLRTLTTDHGALVGTLGYMAPEQCTGSRGAADVRSDVYALGVVLYELVCARPPRELSGQSPVEALRRVAVSSVVRPSEADPSVTGDLEQILLHALEREVGDRYQSAEDLGRDIDRFLRHEPIEARRPGAARRLSLFIRRHRVESILMAAAALTLAAFLIVVPILYFAARARQREIADASRSVRGVWQADGERVASGFIMAPLFGRNRSIAGGTAIVSIQPGKGPPGIHLLDGVRVVATSSFDIAVPSWFDEPRVRRFDLYDAQLGDFRPDEPGDEVLAVLTHVEKLNGRQRAFCVIRILRLNMTTISEAWSAGVPHGVAWMRESDQLVLTLGFSGLMEHLHGTAPYDARWCAGAHGFAHDVVAVAMPVDRLADVVFPLPTTTGGARTPIGWVIHRLPDELNDRSRTATFSALVAVEDFEMGRNAPVAVVITRASLVPPGLPEASRVFERLSAPIGPDGLQRGAFVTEVGAVAASQPRLGFVDAQRVRAVVSLEEALIEHRIAELPDLDNLDAMKLACLADAALAGAHTDAVIEMAVTMATNWRSLHRIAGKMVVGKITTSRGDPLAHALRLAERARDLHDLRCPSPDDCEAAWYCYSELARALAANRRFEDALWWYRRTEIIWSSRFTEEGPESPLDLAGQAMCLAELGRVDEAKQCMARAIACPTLTGEALREELTTSLDAAFATIHAAGARGGP